MPAIFQESAAADADVHQWLESTQLNRDLRLKVLHDVDDLDMTVKMREAFP